MKPRMCSGCSPHPPHEPFACPRIVVGANFFRDGRIPDSVCQCGVDERMRDE